MPGVKGKSGGKRPGAGRTMFKPTDEHRDLVLQLASFGLRHSDICIFIKDAKGKPISEPTMRKNFAAELDTGKIKANVVVAQTLYKKAIAGDTASVIFWLKSQAGWRDTQRVELSGNGGGPVQSVSMTKDEFREIAKAIADEV
jgi:hypothetical protein